MRQLLTSILTLFLFSCGQKSDSKSVHSDTSITIEKESRKREGILLISGQNCAYENDISDLGTGLIIVPSTFEIYEDSLLTRKTLTINMHEEAGKIKVYSFFFKPDYGIMHFICLNENANSYKILTGFSDIKYLPKKDNYEYVTWQNYILQSYGVRRSTDESHTQTTKQPLKTNPTENSKNLNIPNKYEMFCPLEIKGDYLKVKYDCFYNIENNPNEGEPCNKYIDKCENPVTGWIKWKKRNKLLIDIFLMP